MTPFSTDPYLSGNPIVGAVVVPDDAEWPVLAPGQIVFVERLQPRGANYFERVFALDYEGAVIVRHIQIFGPLCRVWGANENYRWGSGRALELPPVEGWPKADWTRSGFVRPQLPLLGPVVYPYRHAAQLETGRPVGRRTPAIYFAWGN